MFQKNDLVTLTIEDLSDSGEGIGRAEGFALFVKDALPGDTVRARILKCKKSYGFARVEQILTPSPDRCDPLCPEHRRCGGCQLQGLTYEKQLTFKQKKVRDSLTRIGGFAPDLIDAVTEPIAGMTEGPWRYRNKAQYPVGVDRSGHPVTGFYAGRTHDIIPSKDCLLEPEENREILEAILSCMKAEHIAPYDETTGKGILRHILIRRGRASGEVMVCLVINARTLPKQEAFIRALKDLPGMKSISYSANTERSNVILGSSAVTIWGEDAITDSIRMRDASKPDFPLTGRELSFRISPLSFFQVNPLQMEKLYSIALSYADVKNGETVWDLYCGIGTISLFLAAGVTGEDPQHPAGKVYGVEIIPEAIRDARENAVRNGISNAAFFVGAAEEVLPAFYETGGDLPEQAAFGDPLEQSTPESRALHPDVIVVDPPRKGCDSSCLETILRMSPDRIVYVSCDPASLARDLRILCDGGYEIRRLRGVDMFPQTVHVEVCCLLERLRSAKEHIEITIDADEYYRIKDNK